MAQAWYWSYRSWAPAVAYASLSCGEGLRVSCATHAASTWLPSRARSSSCSSDRYRSSSPAPLGSLSLTASTTHQRRTVGSTGEPSAAQRAAGSASRSNHAMLTGFFARRPLVASASSASGARSAEMSSPSASSAVRSAARTTSLRSLPSAARSAGTASTSPSRASHSAALRRTSDRPFPRPCSASPRTPGCVLRAACAVAR
ncbi:Uncharacterised protein [Mycobacteroides abscessus]|nr:Uncharacterised protein [Mycobacteroides abscessus]